MYREHIPSSEPSVEKPSLWKRFRHWLDINCKLRQLIVAMIYGALLVGPLAALAFLPNNTPTNQEAYRLSEQWLAVHHLEGTITCYLEDRKRPIRYCDVVMNAKHIERLSCSHHGCMIDNQSRTP